MIQIRRIHTHVEDIFHEFGPAPEVPLRRGAIAVVLSNPYAGRYVADILPLMQALQPLGVDLARRLCRAMQVPPGRIESYGKGAIIGAAGELEHGALWHVPGGYAMRETLGWTENHADRPGNALAIVPSTKKVGPPGVAIDVPLTHINASYVRDHLDAIEVRIPGAPAAGELAFILAMSTGPRIHARLGGLKADRIERWDGQR